MRSFQSLGLKHGRAVALVFAGLLAAFIAVAGSGCSQKAGEIKNPGKISSASGTWREPVTGMEFVRVPAGVFEMGCHGNAGRCDRDERPLRTVRLDRFWLGRDEVTQGQWTRIMGRNPSKFHKGDNFPVEQVSWNDVQEFIQKLNRRSSAKFRLPTEAQWEYACRSGGLGVTFGTGNGLVTPRSANFNENKAGPTPVGSYPPNSLGLHDMSGNVYEWVQDVKTSYRNVGTQHPRYQQSGAVRGLRGGSWAERPRNLRCTYRGFNAPARMGDDLGFRLLRLE